MWEPPTNLGMHIPASTAPDIEESGPKEVAFLLGAGASVEAGVPDTAKLIQAFREQETDDGDIGSFLEMLAKWAETQGRMVDIELVLETLQRLTDWSEEPLAALQKKPITVKGIKPRKLLQALRDFIKKQVLVDPTKISYLEPLRGFVDTEKPLSIYSLNYDTAIEIFCAENRLVYRDGFGEDWNSQVFDDPNIDLRLFKLHGSVTWYRTDRGRFLKIPVLLKESSVELVTKERADALMLYPAQKLSYVEPLFELLLQMKKRLATCQFLVVVGYSFRDDHIRQILWDIARVSQHFTIILISPEAGRIYREKLAHYPSRNDSSPNDSSLRGRVICLPFAFGKVLPVLRRDFLDHARLFSREWEIRSAQERQGRGVSWTEAADQASQCGHIEAARAIFAKSGIRENIDNYKRLDIIMRSLFFAAANNDMDSLAFFRDEMEAVWQNFIRDATVDASYRTIRMTIKKGNMRLDIRDLVQRLPELKNVIVGYQDLMIEQPEAAKVIVMVRDMILALEARMSCWASNSGTSPESYAENRQNETEEDFQRLLDSLQNEEDAERFKVAAEAGFLGRHVKETEAKVISTIFSHSDG